MCMVDPGCRYSFKVIQTSNIICQLYSTRLSLPYSRHFSRRLKFFQRMDTGTLWRCSVVLPHSPFTDPSRFQREAILYDLKHLILYDISFYNGLQYQFQYLLALHYTTFFVRHNMDNTDKTR